MNAYAQTVSIGLPVFDGGRYLRHALERVMQQEFREFELIIFDNASNKIKHQELCQRNSRGSTIEF